MLGLERDAWSMAKRPSQAINEYCPLSLQEVVTPENKTIHWTLSSIFNKVRLPSGSWSDAAQPSCDSPNTPRRFALGASNAGPVGENPTRSVPAL